MTVVQNQYSIPSNGSQVVVLSGAAINSSQINLRNTGTVNVLLGPQTFLAPPLNFTATPNQTGGSFASGAIAYWKITATNASGETIGSTEATASFNYATNTGSATLSWTAVTGATGYKIYRSTVSQTYTSPALVTTIGSGATTTYTATGGATTAGTPPSISTASLPVLFPLLVNEYLGFTTEWDDIIVAQVQTTGTAGQITILGMG